MKQASRIKGFFYYHVKCKDFTLKVWRMLRVENNSKYFFITFYIKKNIGTYPSFYF